MLTAAPPISLNIQPTSSNGFLGWLQTHRGAVVVAGLLAFAGPLTFFTGALSVMRTSTAVDTARLGGWWTLYGISFWCALLFTGYACARIVAHLAPNVGWVISFVAACVAAAVPNLLTAERATLLIEQGLVHGVRTMHLHGFIFSLIMALLYFAHLRRARDHGQAVARLAAAQMAQRQTQRRIIQARLQEMQARIDPQLLFEMLDVLRRLHEQNATQAERFLDELISFLRAALPRLRAASSSLLREAELARAFVRLHALAHDADFDMQVDISSDVMHARFPPGVLLPLLDAAVVGRAGGCRLVAARSDDLCRLTLTLDVSPSKESVERVQSLLLQLYGTSGKLDIERATNAIHIVVRVPYELA